MSYLTAQEEFAAMSARPAYSSLHPEDVRTSSEGSIPGSASSRASSPHSPVISPALPPAVYQIPSMHFDANTGPKGVIADAQSFERARKRTFRQTIYGISTAVGNNVLGVSEKLTSSVRTSSRRRDSDRSSSGSSEDEDDFMRSWREKRMLELKAGTEVRTRRLSPSKRRWGHLANVDPVCYLDAIEKVASDTTVVVMIGDDSSPVSSMVENALSNLARKHEFTRFVKLSYQDAEMDSAGIPAILAYKRGDLFSNLTSVANEIPIGRDLSVSSLESVLKTHGILF